MDNDQNFDYEFQYFFLLISKVYILRTVERLFFFKFMIFEQYFGRILPIILKLARIGQCVHDSNFFYWGKHTYTNPRPDVNLKA